MLDAFKKSSLAPLTFQQAPFSVSFQLIIEGQEVFLKILTKQYMKNLEKI